MRFALGAATAAAILAGGAWAAPVSYEFEGTWGSGVPFIFGAFSGTFSYDTDAAMLFEFDNLATYEGLSLTIDVFDDGSEIVSITPTASVVDVALGDTTTSNVDFFAVTLLDPADPGIDTLEALIPGAAVTALQLSFFFDRTAFRDTSLPASLDPSLLVRAELNIRYESDGRRTFSSSRIAAFGPTAEVPLPAGLPLVAAGIGALVLVRRSKAGKTPSSA